MRKRRKLVRKFLKKMHAADRSKRKFRAKANQRRFLRLRNWVLLHSAIIVGLLFIIFLNPEHLIPKSIAFLAVLLLILNWNMYPLFYTIKKGKNKSLKKRLVRYSRKMMPLHPWIGLAGILLALLHGWLMWQGFSTFSITHFSGSLALGIGLFLLGTGLYRKRKATGKRRKLHLFSAGLFLFLVILHIIL